MTGPDRNILGDAFPGPEFAGVRDWLSGLGGTGEVSALPLLADAERITDQPARPAAGPGTIRSVGIIGGGTAGYLTALALRAKRPWLEVSVVESPRIPVIGVGEATVPSMLTFLHHYLGIGHEALAAAVRPTWKLGIRFDWGTPAGFMAPFDWAANSLGVLGALADSGGIDSFTLQSMLMGADRVPVFKVGGQYVSLLKYLRFAYHLDNASLVQFLTSLAEQRGVRHLKAEVGEVVLSGPEQVGHLRTTDGQRLSFDFYVDCSGFRSLLLGQALGTPFRSYQSSLRTDSAVTGNVEHGGRLKPYTTATTMNAGWCWRIPTRHSDHLGYVYSSGAISDDDAAGELARRYPGVTEPRYVRFRVGRHEQAWRGNVMAVGNSYAFVEPLESSGLLMITLEIAALVSCLPASWSRTPVREVINLGLAQKWDALRWFLAVHYRYNQRLDTPFWQAVRAETDVSGIQPVLDLYADAAPLRYRNAVVRGFARAAAPPYYGLAGLDTILLGQGVPTNLLKSGETMETWRRRQAAARALTRVALPQEDALALTDSDPSVFKALLSDQDSWAAPAITEQLGFG